MWESEQKKKSIKKIILFVCLLSGLTAAVFLIGKAVKGPETAEVSGTPQVSGKPGVSDAPSETQGELAPMEIVGNIMLTDVPAADYAFSFDRQLDGAKVVTRQGDIEGFNEGTEPEENTQKEPVFIEGIEGSAIYLDGSYGVELCGIAPLSDSYTISFWMKAEEMHDWSPFLTIGSNLLDANVSQNYLCFNKKTTEEGNDVVPVYNTINAVLGYSCEVRPCFDDKKCIHLDEWNYITIRVDGTDVSEEDEVRVAAQLYLNSELIGYGEVCRMSFDETDMKAYIGINCYDILFRVAYDEIRIWNCLLDEEQISSMYVAYVEQRQQE